MRNVGAFLVVVSGASLAAAAPVTVAYDAIVPGTLEDFEGYPPGSTGEPAPPAGGGGTIAFPPVFDPGVGGSGRFTGFSAETNSAWAPTVLDAPACIGQCLGMTVSPLYSPIAGTPTPPILMTFKTFLPGTKSFGTEFLGGSALHSIVLQGATTSLVVPVGSTGGWESAGFHDPEGLVSVTFRGAEQFDDVVTSRMAPIPLPPTSTLMLLGVLGMTLLRIARASPP